MILGDAILAATILCDGSEIAAAIADPWEELDWVSARWINKQGDVLPVMRARLRQKNYAAIDWEGASVVFVYRRPGAAVVRKTAEILSYTAIEALAQVVWDEDDFAEAGEFPAEFEATLASGKIETFPKGAYITMVVVADLR